MEIKGGKETKEKKSAAKEGKRCSGKGQMTLDEKVTRRVTFAEEEKEKRKERERMERQNEEFKESILEEVRKIRQEKLEIEKVKLEIQAASRDIEERVDRLEKKMAEWLCVGQSVKSISSTVSSGAESVEGDTEPAWSVRSVRTTASDRSVLSTLTDREVSEMKRLIHEQDRIERKDNVIIRGVEPQKENTEKWMKLWFEKNLGIVVNILFVRKSGPVLVVRVGESQKKEIMKMKSKLRGTNVFIENDLNFDDRKKQEAIHKWVALKKNLGWVVKAGTGRVWVNNVWRERRREMQLKGRWKRLQRKDKMQGREVVM